MHVTRQPVARLSCRVRHSIDPDVDDHRAELHHICRDEFRSANGGDKHIGLTREHRKAGGLRMAHRHCGVGPCLPLHRKQRRGFAHDKRAADHHDMLARKGNVTAAEQFHDTSGDQAPPIDLHEFRKYSLGKPRHAAAPTDR